MADIVPPDVRSRMMAGIRGKNTKPEMLIRRALHARGFRYVLHDKRLPGKPDMVFPKYNAVMFVHGCFWHGHDCHLFKWPKTRTEFWRTKIERNREIDEASLHALSEAGWRTCVIWECALKGREQLPLDYLVGEISHWVLKSTDHISMRGLDA